ncbi:HNH endonuclease [Candidatus Pacearchaeota archaeon]|nr:HNH endonuclease [Candidatus Pacearchaeota archaeon]
MRPVTRGKKPVNDNDKEVEFKHYKDASRYLIERLGCYCSYCEAEVPWRLAVEHIRPKDSNPILLLEWSNFLLACESCNGKKKDKNVSLDEYLWPDRDNTFRAFKYEKGGLVKVNQRLGRDNKNRAEATLKLVGLDKKLTKKQLEENQKWRSRKHAWDVAVKALKNYKKIPTKEMKQQILETALGRGHFSMWMTVFKHEGEMLKVFIKGFPNTCINCFDEYGKARKRSGGFL